jgi:uncharacterized protein YecE (DUF72 family)
MGLQTEYSPKELKFVQEYVALEFNGKRAYMSAYETDNENMAAVEAHKMLKKQKIQDLIEQEEGSYRQLAREAKLNRKAIVKRLGELINDKTTVMTKEGESIEIDPDGKTVIQAINTLAKLEGDFAPETKKVELETSETIDTSKMNPEELKELKEKIIADLAD